jgi:glutamate dehydrogenase
VVSGASIQRDAEAKAQLLREAAVQAEALAASIDRYGRAVRPLDGDLAGFLADYYRDLEYQEIADLGADAIAAAALGHLSLASERPPGRAVVSVFSPDAERDGWSSPVVAVDVVTDDMPFLVDSVTAELARHAGTLQLVVHPMFVVRRQLTGELVEVLEDLPTGEGPVDLPPGSGTEAWIHVEVLAGTQADDESNARLQERLRQVLGDVAVAVEDWQRMRREAQRLADELESDPPPFDPADVEESAALLRWLTEDNFTFVGYREYDLGEDADGGLALRAVPGTGLGILRSDRAVSRSFALLPPEVRARALEPRLLVLTKANSRSTVHRPAYLDYLGVKRFGPDGEVVGERRFLGLFTASAYTQSVRAIPFLRRKADAVMELSGYALRGHNAKDLQEFLETYPRDELFQVEPADLLPVAVQVLHMQERRQVRLFLRADVYGRFVSCLVYLPRDRYSTSVRLAIEAILRETYDAESVDYTARVSESVLARLHFVVRVPASTPVPDVDVVALEARVLAATRIWTDDLFDVLAREMDRDSAYQLLERYGSALPEGYKEDFSPEVALHDIRRLERLKDEGSLDVRLYTSTHSGHEDLHFKVFREGGPVSLSTALPMLQHMGADVVEENVYDVRRPDGTIAWVHDFGFRPLSGTGGAGASAVDLRQRFEETFLAMWSGHTEADGFNALVVHAGLTWRQASIVRGYARYLRQVGSTFSQQYVEQALVANAGIVCQLVELFEARFDPGGETDREGRTAALVSEIEYALDAVLSLDHDRILRSLLAVVTATTRTTYFQRDATGAARGYLAFKLDPSKVPDLPKPHPRHEVWVHSPSVEGVHLRFGDVARGGLRWSDRREDFRTEVLGLVKAQAVKNAVIVPTGAKGGFVVRNPVADPNDRAAAVAEGVTAYRTFVSALLDLTDNRVHGEVVPPEDVVRHDGDDSYLVVAADKGTASFSDVANEVSVGRGFWLGDAFASGGSAGYDHKEMGITARGAWESVKRHFRELGVDVQTQEFTVAGIGDMSGDVFGNGMLLSPCIRLVAAFDHRHVFLDPSPDAAVSLAERRRLFDLPRSSWVDYDPSLISEGGGVHARSAKSVPLTPQVRTALGIDPSVTALTPAELIRAILLSPVDLLWNGGIGTYVKCATETHADVGDKTNDGVRIDGAELRCRVVGEGGNLGFTQLGRIEAAKAGIRINTDAIDNSAGVDTSDHEVNLKILLDAAVRDGELDGAGRDALLHDMADEVAALVLADNYEQNVLLGNARYQHAALSTVHQRMIQALEEAGELDRVVEFLPSDHEFEQRRAAHRGLTSPELAVVLAYAKLTTTARLLDTDLPDAEWTGGLLRTYFPPQLVQRFGDRLDAHPLRRQIVTTVLVNDMVNWAGSTYVFRAMEETSAGPDDVARAYVVARDVFGLADFWQRVCELDNVAPTRGQTELLLESRRMLDRSTRWLLLNRSGTLDVPAEIERFAVIADLVPKVPMMLRGFERERLESRAVEIAGTGAPEVLAGEVALMLDTFPLLDVVEIAGRQSADPESVARIYYVVSDRYDADAFLSRITDLQRGDRWAALARSSMRYDLYTAIAGLTEKVVAATDPSLDADARVAEWEDANAAALARAEATLRAIGTTDSSDLAILSVALRAIRALVTTTT